MYLYSVFWGKATGGYFIPGSCQSGTLFVDYLMLRKFAAKNTLTVIAGSASR
jgi:hypothetical protein